MRRVVLVTWDVWCSTDDAARAGKAGDRMEVDAMNVAQRSPPSPTPPAESSGQNPRVTAIADVRVKNKAKAKTTSEDTAKESASIYKMLFNAKSSAHREFPAAMPLGMGHTTPGHSLEPRTGAAETGADRGPCRHLDIVAEGAGWRQWKCWAIQRAQRRPSNL